MNFDSILQAIKGFITPKQPDVVSPLPIGDTYTPALAYNQQLEAQKERQAHALNMQQHPDVTISPTARPTVQATPTPVPDIPDVLAGATMAQEPSSPATPTPTPGDDLWGQFVDATRRRAISEGYNPEVVVSQKALESNFGRSNFAKERNNFGGIGAYDSDPNKAFKFDNINQYLDYYFNLVKNKYPDAYANRKNPRKYVEGLKKGGYASDPNYVDKVLTTRQYPR